MGPLSVLVEVPVERLNEGLPFPLEVGLGFHRDLGPVVDDLQ